MSTVNCQMSNVASPGFTIIELLVVIAIMGTMTGLILVNFAGQRSNRNIKIAQNELVSNLRRAQSNTLSSKNIYGSVTAQYYLLKFDSSKPKEYTIQAMYDVSSAPKLVDIETIKLPQGIRLAASGPVTITSNVLNPSGPFTCFTASFKTPFAKTYLGFGCTNSPPNISVGDDYDKILKFVSNTNYYPVSNDSTMVIKLTNDNNTLNSKVLIKGTTGLICPTINETTCGN